MKNIYPKILNTKHRIYSSSFRKGVGFTIVELLVSAAVLIIIFSFVLASFRTGQSSGELDVVLKQVIDGVSTVRNMSLGGQVLDDGLFPAGGYGINFNLAEQPDQYILYAVAEVGGNYSPGDELSVGITQFKNIELIKLCGLAEEVISDATGLPCQRPDWKELKHADEEYLEVIFPLSGEVLINYPPHPALGDLYYVGGVIEHQKTNRQAYFYVSLASGLVTGSLVYE